MLGEAAEDVGDAVGDARPLPPPDHPKSISLVAIPTKTERNRLDSAKAEGGAHALLIREGSDDGAEEHGGTEAGDEEAADVALVEAVLAVEVVHVGPLQPVPSCTIHPPEHNNVRDHQTPPALRPQSRSGGRSAATRRGFEGGTRNQESGGRRTHHEGVDEDVVVLEGVEGRGGGDSVLAGLAELQRRHDGGERAEHEVVERLHGGPGRSRGVEGGKGGGIWGVAIGENTR